MTVADFRRPIAPPLDDSSCSQQDNGSPRVRHVTFTPSTRRIYKRPVRMTLGFRSVGLFAHLTPASYAVRVPRARVLPMASFPPPIARTQLPHRLRVPVIKAPRGLSPPSHFPVRFRSPVIQRQFMALRAMPGAPKKAAVFRPPLELLFGRKIKSGWMDRCKLFQYAVFS